MKTSKKMLSLLLIAAMLVSVLCMGVSATEDYDPVSISEGEPVTISWNGTTGTVVSVDGSSYIPQEFLLWAQIDYTVEVNGTAISPNREPGEDDTAAPYTITTNATNNTVIVASNGTTTYTVTCPHYTAAATGVNPADVNGYLPVGQFARWNSFGWGTLYTDNTNVSSSSNDVKFKTGYVSTGVSLGMAGGYVQFDMGNNRIQNNANNKYGIDFIVYGNAFVGNPEAAGVQVSNDGVNWYTLAGSRHYMSDTKWNQNISYVRLTADNTSLNDAFTAAGIYVSTNFEVPSSDNASDVDAAIGAATWTGVPQLTGSTYPKTYSTATPAAAAWWPEYAQDSNNKDENYGNVWNIDNTVNGVSWLRSGSAEVITYTGVTTVEDDMVVLNEGATAAPSQAEMTDVYQWGYADVRVNGSQYGTIVNNPYADAPSAVGGGDGFDLAWAVDANGNPVQLSSVRYVRVYSAVLFSAGVFGETSAEVCGLYVANGDGSGAATTTPTVKVGTSTVTTSNMGTVTKKVYSATTKVTVTSGAENIYVNGEKVTSGTEITFSTPSGSTNYVQVITQSGTEAPYITMVKITR
ncbi:MAG TPA: hypothetical protein DEQ85_07020 [Clostridiales bacterium]|nr:hypothetical protein [Clostridiales bacterium]